MNNYVTELNDKNWVSEVLNYEGVTLVDVWAPWCGPCKLIGPIIDELAMEYSGKAKIGKLNADQNQKPMDLGVSGIPTLILYKNGEEVDRIVGMAPKNQLQEKLNYYSQESV
ncbi:MAG: thioredoxin [Nitrospinaceae bacterium]|jgi:thioredoxin 1|nr:thioredoxin [Candidatus Neomarinimicrobiota bacterium]MBT3961763.1 thioredoxin [Candidatus Neomarinimicrobiota bacterium]MBT7515123.1 thioredoxin [Candidatus Neomarinimicrobiota bacterium]|tara:strand:- start:1101 stop:1436 length:336 start_codon:yes stop_codon:yes gene_type:complete